MDLEPEGSEFVANTIAFPCASWACATLIAGYGDSNVIFRVIPRKQYWYTHGFRSPPYAV